MPCANNWARRAIKKCRGKVAVQIRPWLRTKLIPTEVALLCTAESVTRAGMYMQLGTTGKFAHRIGFKLNLKLIDPHDTDTKVLGPVFRIPGAALYREKSIRRRSGYEQTSL
jgi:hypothetical protein